jgi:RNA polymerase sigma factor (sigma-70 family)
MMTIRELAMVGLNDTELVAASRAGNREAFGQVVARYQSLLCALAYNATGSLTQSEDLAQETFITAWKQLAELREPAKLRPWLCGIARCLIGKALRRDGREPVHAAESLDAVPEAPALEPQPPDYAVSKEEEAILWRSLERIPDTYREPLILFYREHQSVEQVADALELSEDAVKQRLSRGRKLLHEQVLAFVEGTLGRTNPGKAFTLGVLAALPLVTTSAKPAVVGAVAVKGTAAAKAAASVGLVTAILGPVVIFVSTWFGYKLDVGDAGSPQRRQFVIKTYRLLVVCMAVFILAVLALTFGGRKLEVSNPKLFAGLFIGLGAAYVLFVLILNLWMMRCRRKLREQELPSAPPGIAPLSLQQRVPLFEYRSKLSLFGLPLVHVRLRAGIERGPVKAWFAAGDAAIGVIFAFGGVAVAPISFGGLAVGIFTLGGLAVGLVAFGGFSLAPWALGGFAVGWRAFGGCAVGWSAAAGAVAVAREFAQVAVALADHANDAAASAFFKSSGFFQNVQIIMRHSLWLYWICLLPLALWWKHRRNERKRLEAGN